jgi:hypothetical protein
MGTMFPRKLLSFSEIILAHRSSGLHSLLHLLLQQLPGLPLTLLQEPDIHMKDGKMVPTYVL